MRIGFIGAGKMGGAIIKGLIASNFISNGHILASEINEQNAKKVASELGIAVVTDNNILVEKSDIVVICTKPFIMEEVLNGIQSSANNKKLFISIAAGVTTEKMENILGDVPVVRVMPNTPAFLGEGMSVLAKGKFASKEQILLAQKMFDQVGKTAIIKEDLMDAATGISGSGPAFMYLVIEALAKGGIELGLDEDIALELASQTAIGAAKMVMETGKSPEQLRVEVTTPGGCTEVGLNVMNDKNVSGIFNEVVKATARKAKELG